MVSIDGSRLSISEVIAVARNYETVELSEEAHSRINNSHEWILEIVQSGNAFYGVNTGFGIFADKTIKQADILSLNRNLILSHAVSIGDELPIEVVRAAILIRANTLAIGHSGVRLDLISTLIEMLNRKVTPIIPSQGSLGSSGDLSPLAHLALVLTTDENDFDNESGWALFNGKKISGKTAMKEAGISRIILQPKEGLALTNGATFSTAIGALACSDADHYLSIAELSLATSLEALLSPLAAFDERVHALRPHPGQLIIANRIKELTHGSTLINSGGKIQDAYSLRCTPQVHGAARDTLEHTKKVIERELNSVTDNPIIFGPIDVVSGGNFHGEPVGLVMDFLSIAMTEIGAISERRIFRLLDENLNMGLPPMLVENKKSAGINSGMMMPHYTAVSLALENQILASPDSIHSLPTSGEQEDHNSNAMTAARHCRQIINNTANILAIELFCGCRALDLRMIEHPDRKPGKGVDEVYHLIRSKVPYISGDHLWGPEINKVRTLIKDITI